ncbi:hypothetical protein [Mucilaginibacter gynuensis]|uniref:hypothetical protein n=1 Tax=Mucilaginibacter gynuensis TaxID=1302236 RepID=UPI0031ECABE9
MEISLADDLITYCFVSIQRINSSGRIFQFGPFVCYSHSTWSETCRFIYIDDIRPGEDVPSLRRALCEANGDNLFMNTYRHLRCDGTIRDVQISRLEIAYQDRAAFLVMPMPVTIEPLSGQLGKLFNKVNFALVQKAAGERKRLSELRTIVAQLEAGQSLSRQIALISRIKVLLEDVPGVGLN